MRIPVRRLSGWTPKSTTTYEYDDTGRIVRSVTTTEPEWDEEQVDLALAWIAYRADIGKYGELLSEAQDERAHPNNYTGGYRYVGRGPFWNYAERAVKQKEREYRQQQGDNVDMDGAFFIAEKIIG